MGSGCSSTSSWGQKIAERLHGSQRGLWSYGEVAEMGIEPAGHAGDNGLTEQTPNGPASPQGGNHSPADQRLAVQSAPTPSDSPVPPCTLGERTLEVGEITLMCRWNFEMLWNFPKYIKFTQQRPFLPRESLRCLLLCSQQKENLKSKLRSII